MMSRVLLVGALALAGAVSSAETLRVASPDGTLAVDFHSDATGLAWSLSRKGKTLVAPSPLGLVFDDPDGAAGAKKLVLGPGMRVAKVVRRASDSTWRNRLYRRLDIRDRFNEMTVSLETRTRPVRKMDLVFRAYEEGAAFRYALPKQEKWLGFQLYSELTEWCLPTARTLWTTAYRGHFTGQESPFVRGTFDSLTNSVVYGMPVLVRTEDQSFALTEAALRNWAGFFFRKGAGRSLKAELSPFPKSAAATDGVAVIRTFPAESPWRVAICGDDELDLCRRNDLVVNLNPPPEKDIDFSFVKPGATSWDWWVESNNSLSTELTLRLVDFAAEMGWPYHTIDGGWYGFARRPNHGPNVELKPRPGFDLERIVAHAKAKGVGIWVWIHWRLIDDTGIEETFARLEKWGVSGVKTDFLNRQDQWIVNWYEKVCRAAAKHRVMVNFHGAFKPTGTERTWPNNLTREGILGNEMNIFDRQITPAHVATLPFTRFLIGPGDFTPGGFGNVFSKDFIPQVKKGHRYGDETDRCPHWAEEMGTRAHALALCVAFDSSLMTLCDWPERSRGAAGIEALRSLPTVWKRTIPVAGKCGEYYAVLRETHDGRFYFAAFTVKGCTIELPLAFLGEGTADATVFSDDSVRTPKDAKALAVTTRTVTSREKISFALCDEGGVVAIFKKGK